MKLLASGIDTLNLSVKGTVREPVWDLLAEVQGRARANEDVAPLSFPVTEEAFECRPYGWRGYTYWLSSPDYELMVGRSAKFPAVLVQMHSAFLHSVGIDPALDQVERLLRLDLIEGPFKQGVSRIDVHADLQGWELRTSDLDRFVGYGRHRGAFDRQMFQSGSRLDGFQFGKDALLARLYDKTAEIRKHGVSWLPDLWGEDFDPGSSVWRLEFQFRREALTEFHFDTVDEVIASVQDLWHYGTVKWLSLARPDKGPASATLATRPRVGGGAGGANRSDDDRGGAPPDRAGVGVEAGAGDPGLRDLAGGGTGPRAARRRDEPTSGRDRPLPASIRVWRSRTRCPASGRAV